MSSAKSILAAARLHGQQALSEYDSKRVLAAYGIPVTREVLAADGCGAAAAAGQLGYPVALKVCADSIAHKTEHGLIRLGVRDAAELEPACDELLAAAPAGGQLLVQEMVSGQRELLVGMVRDPVWGPVVVLGLGGVMAEGLDDTSVRVAPVTRDDVEAMIGELRGYRLLAQFRGMPAVDLVTLTACLQGLGRAAMENPEIQQIDINPLVLRGGEPVAVDGLVVLGESERDDLPGVEDDSAVADGRRSAGLEPFFAPRSVAVVGASAREGRPGNDVVRNLIAQDYDGDIYLVNPKGGQIEGLPVHSSIAELPHGIDLAIVILPAAANPGAIRELGGRGVPAVVLAAGGFAEVGEEGAALQEETAAALRETGMRAVGPNTAGHVSTPARFTSSFFSLGRVPPGPISYIAQTGNFATHTLRYIMSTQNFGVARVIGVGNKLDVEESEVLEYLAGDPETKAIFVYLESIMRPRRFLDIARRATRLKPVVMLKGGASDAGARAAVAHTAALATDDRITDSALKQAGIVRVHRYSHLILAAKAMAHAPLPAGPRVGFAAPSGAMLVCLTDLCHRHLGLRVPDLEEASRQRLQDLSPPFIRMRNPVDIWPAVTVHGVEHAYREGADVLLGDANTDAVVMVLMLTEQLGVPSLDFLVALRQTYPAKPLLVAFTGDRLPMEEARDYLEPRGVPTFPLIEDAFEALDIMCRCRAAQIRPSEPAA